ncbi:unnamed protein product [Caenorhabditis auriculariae]|uniref:Uncharacterized protein n=1 Tax=Caenorhabditis auriculariae TaxID=2777116 RepID=A0A8S1GR57_9PELO|nr:unnamed protein product [Caenorhabditis auriculariae]
MHINHYLAIHSHQSLPPFPMENIYPKLERPPTPEEMPFLLDMTLHEAPARYSGSDTSGDVEKFVAALSQTSQQLVRQLPGNVGDSRRDDKRSTPAGAICIEPRYDEPRDVCRFEFLKFTKSS